MSEEEILSELRAIRTLLSLDKKEQLEQIIDGLSDKQKRILDELDGQDWTSIPTSEISEEFDVSDRSIQNHLGKLVDKNLIEKQGYGAGTEYRATGLLEAAEIVKND